MDIEIRIRSSSEIDFDSVRVVFPDRNEAHFWPIAKGTTSDFTRTAHAYRYAEIHINAGGRELMLRPYDYVGERPLARTLYLRAGRPQRRFTIDLEKAA